MEQENTLTIEEICKQIEQFYAQKNIANSHKINRLVYQFTAAFQSEKVNEHNLQLILDLELAVASSKNPLKQSTEKSLLSYLTYFPRILFDDDSIKPLPGAVAI